MIFLAALTSAIAVVVTIVWFGRHVSNRWCVALAPVFAVLAFQIWKLAIAADQAASVIGVSLALTVAVALRWHYEVKGAQS